MTDVSTLSISVLHENIALSVKQKFPHLDHVKKLVKNLSYTGYNYRTGMVLVHGSLAGLPEFCDIVKMIVSQEILLFIVKL